MLDNNSSGIKVEELFSPLQYSDSTPPGSIPFERAVTSCLSPHSSSILECKGERECYYYWDNLESVLIYFLKENKSLSTFVTLLLGGLDEEHSTLLTAGMRIPLRELELPLLGKCFSSPTWGRWVPQGTNVTWDQEFREEGETTRQETERAICLLLRGKE